MKQKCINLKNYPYLCEYFENGVDFDDLYYAKEFVILRNYTIYNDVAYDTDIYFVEKSIYEKIKNKEQTSEIVFPININSIMNYSNSFESFNNYHLLTPEDFCYSLKSDNNKFKVDNENNAKIKCDKIKIYNPTIHSNCDFIIHVDNIICGINFHYFCSLNKNFVKKAKKEIAIDKYKYVEYIEIYFPNVKQLFDINNKYYIQDDINNIININNENIRSVSDYYVKKYDESEDEKNDKLYFNQLIRSYFIKREGDVYNKIYITNDEFNYNSNFINTTINVTLFPYVDISNHKYIANEDLPPMETFFENEYYFRLQSYFGFDNGIISLINKFVFPGKIPEDSEEYNLAIHGDIYDENYKNKYIHQVTNFYNSFFIDENVGEYYDHEDYLDEIDIDEIRTTGYYIQIATDVYFNDIIYESKINTDNDEDNFIYDFSFSLNNIVDSWYQLNDILAVRSTFIDKRLNVYIRGNITILTKEWFKYLINDSSTYNVIFTKQNNLIDVDFMEVNKGFNLINNINCSIIDKVVENNNLSKYSIDDNGAKIIYKPIFFRVNELQNVRIREGITQNIGINLEPYMTKVETFVLNIDGYSIKEHARNGIYVIFSVNAVTISEDSGIYNILDQNFEYISSGNYIKY